MLRKHDVYSLKKIFLLSLPNRAFVENIDEFLYRRNAIDAALLFETESELDQVCDSELNSKSKAKRKISFI